MPTALTIVEALEVHNHGIEMILTKVTRKS